MKLKLVCRLLVFLLCFGILAAWGTGMSASALTLDSSAKIITGDVSISYSHSSSWPNSGFRYSTETDCSHEPQHSNENGKNMTANSNSDGSVTFTLTAVSSYQTGTLIKKSAQNRTTTLTLTNSTANKLAVSYKDSSIPELSGSGTFYIDGNSSKNLSVVASTTSSASTSVCAVGSITITDIKVAVPEPIRFYSTQYGSYTYTVGSASGTVAVGSEYISTEIAGTATEYAGTALTATLTSQTNSDYKFVGWYSDGKLLGTGTTLSTTTTGAMNIYPAFVPKDTVAPFTVDGAPHYFWASAMYASASSGKPAKLVDNFTLPATLQDNGLRVDTDLVSSADGEWVYTVPAGAKLLVPYSSGDSGTFSQQASYAESNDTPDRSQRHRLLTVGANTGIVVWGQMNVNAQQYAAGRAYVGAVNGYYGQVSLADATASITVEKGGALYCFGFITGEGTVTIKDGGEVTEMLQLRDWRGGNASLAWQGKYESFVFSQYFVQNVEAKLIMQVGSSAYACHTLKASGVCKGVVAPFIGKNAGLFHLTEGELHRVYNPGTDRIQYEIYGQASVENINISVNILLTDYNLNSTDYIMPLHNSMSIYVYEGKLEINNRVKLLPGCEIYVAEGATVEMMEGTTAGGDAYALFIYDESDWLASYTKGSVGASQARFSPSRAECGGTRPVRGSATIVNDGTVIIHGNVFTTSGGSSLDKVITGTGVIKNDKETFVNAKLDEFTQGGTEEDEASDLSDAIVIPITPVVGNIVTGDALPGSYSSFGKDTYYGFSFDADGNGVSYSEWYWSATTPVTVKVVDQSGNVLSSRPAFIAADTALTGYYSDAYLRTAVKTYNGQTELFTLAVAYVEWEEAGKAYTYYENLDDAFRAAQNANCSVHLLRNAFVSGTMAVGPSANVTVYLDGHTITYVSSVFDVCGTLTLKLEGGKITNTTEIYRFASAIRNRNGGELNLDLGGGTLMWAAPSSVAAAGSVSVVYNANGGTANIDLNGGTISVSYPKSLNHNTYRIVAINNAGNMTVENTKTTGQITTNCQSSKKNSDMASGTGRTFYHHSAVFNSGTGDLTLKNVKITDTQTASSDHKGRGTVVYNHFGGKLAIINSVLDSNYGYALVNGGGYISEITGCTLGGYYGVYNYNVAKSTSDRTIDAKGIIELIHNTSITSDSKNALHNRGYIGTISGTSTIRANGGDGNAIMNENTPSFGSYITVTETDDAGNTVVTYDWTDIPTINHITGNVTLVGEDQRAINNKGIINKIDGNVIIKTINSSSSATYCAIALTDGGYIGSIEGNVTVTSTVPNAIYMSGKRIATEVTDANGVSTTTYACGSSIGTISGNVSITGTSYGIQMATGTTIGSINGTNISITGTNAYGIYIPTGAVITNGIKGTVSVSGTTGIFMGSGVNLVIGDANSNITITSTAADATNNDAAIYNDQGSLTLTRATLSSANAYCLINMGGTVESVNGCTLTGKYGISNWNIKKEMDNGVGIASKGWIKLIQDTYITTDQYAIANRGQIDEISGTGTIKSTDDVSYTIYNYNTPCGDSMEYIYVDDGAKRTYFYNWDNVPTIGKITGSISVEGLYNIITTEGLISEISGSVTITAAGTETGKTRNADDDYYAVGIVNGGKIENICGNVNIQSETSRAIKIMGSGKLTKIVTCDGDTVDEACKLTEEYTYRISELTTINGASGDGDTGIVIHGHHYSIYNGGNIDSIGGKLKLTAATGDKTSSGYCVINVSGSKYPNDVVANSWKKVHYGSDYTTVSSTENTPYYAHINILGASGCNISMACRTYPIALQANTGIDVLGDTNSKLVLSAGSTQCIDMGKNSYITELGRSGSNISGTSSRHGIIMDVGSSIRDFCCGKDSVFTFEKKGGTAETFGIKCLGTITNFGGNGGNITINMTASSYATNGVYVGSGGKIVNFGAPGCVINITATSSSTKDAYAVRVDKGGEITNLGVAGSDITLNGKNNGSLCYGLYVANGGVVKQVGDLAAADTCVVITSYNYAIYCNGTIENISNGVVVINRYDGDSYAALYVTAKGNAYVSGGSYRHGSKGRARTILVEDGGVLTYAPCHSLSAEGVTRTMKVTVDGKVQSYGCYYIVASHNWNGGCVCDKCSIFRFYATNVNLGNDLDLMFAIPSKLFADKTEDQLAQYYAEFVMEDGTRKQLAFADWKKLGINGTNSVEGNGYYVVYYSFAAKEMSNVIAVTIYDGEGNAVTITKTDSIQAYAMRILADAEEEKLENLKTVIVDMLNYGTACQEHFGYNTENLANGLLSEEQKGYATQTMKDVSNTIVDTPTFWAGANLVTDSNIQFAVAFRGLSEDATVSYSFTGHKNNEVAGEVTLSAMEENVTGNETYYYFMIPELVVADARCPIEITVTSGGQTVTWTESIEAYIARNADTDDAYTAFMKFADSAHDYLHDKEG